MLDKVDVRDDVSHGGLAFIFGEMLNTGNCTGHIPAPCASVSSMATSINLVFYPAVAK